MRLTDLAPASLIPTRHSASSLMPATAEPGVKPGFGFPSAFTIPSALIVPVPALTSIIPSGRHEMTAFAGAASGLSVQRLMPAELLEQDGRQEVRACLSYRNGAGGAPEEVAGVVAFLASDDAGHVNGAARAVDGGMTAA